MLKNTFSITSIEVGRRTAESSFFLYLTDPGREVKIAYRFWVLRNGSDTILVDTGISVEEGNRRGLTSIVNGVDALSSMGIAATSIKTIILTHLHWDHTSNADRFPNATFLVQKSEIDFFLSEWRQHPSIGRYFTHCEYLESLIYQGRVVTLNGDTEISGGIRTIHVGGHTPGSQMVLVDTEEGIALITGDAIPLLRNYHESIPPGILVDLFAAISAIKTAMKFRLAFIYPGHDVLPHLKVEQ